MVSETGKKSASQKTVTNPGEASVYLSDTIADKRFSVGHMLLLDVKVVSGWLLNSASRILDGGNGPQSRPVYRKNDNKEQ
jgi:hypothetical protein